MQAFEPSFLSAKKEEEIVYDEVKKHNQTSQQTFDTNGK